MTLLFPQVVNLKEGRLRSGAWKSLLIRSETIFLLQEHLLSFLISSVSSCHINLRNLPGNRQRIFQQEI